MSTVQFALGESTFGWHHSWVNRNPYPVLEMKPSPSDLALLENALVAIEMVLARADSEMQGVPYHGPTVNAPLELPGDARTVDEASFRTSAAQSAINICLSSAAALIDVSQALMNRRTDRTPQDLEREWKTVITHTKTASRSAYRAALIMTAQRHVLAAQGQLQSQGAKADTMRSRVDGA